MQRHGIDRQVQRTSSGSTPHEPVTIPQILSSRSPAFDRPRQSTLRYPALVSNRPTVHHARRDPPPIHQPLHRRPTCRGASIPIANLSRGSQIAIAPAARPSFPHARFPPLEAFGRRPRARGPTVMGPASETLHTSRHNRRPSACLKSADIVANVENRTILKISRKSIFGLLCCLVAFQRHYGGP